MKKTFSALALALGVALAAPAHAQQQDHAMQEGPHAPLMHKQELGLSAEQASRLDAIHARMVAAHKQHCEQARGATVEQRRAHHEAMRAQMMAFHTEAAAVLTAEQRARLDRLHAEHHGTAGHHAAHAQHAQHHAQAAAQHAQHAQHGAQAAGQHAQHHAQAAGQHAQHGEHGEGCPCCGAGGTCQDPACRQCCEEMKCCDEHAARTRD